MTNKKFSNPFLKMDHHDLAYAVQRLVRLGKTDEAQVCTLAAERADEISMLEARVAALKAALDVDGPARVRRPYTRRATAKVSRKAVVVGKRPVGRPPGSKNKPRAKVAKAVKAAKAVKQVKRAKKMSPKMMAARKTQGRYLGLRRLLSAQQQSQATKVAQAEGVGAALKFVEAARQSAQSAA